jgi:hypothetical protein
MGEVMDKETKRLVNQIDNAIRVLKAVNNDGFYNNVIILLVNKKAELTGE